MHWLKCSRVKAVIPHVWCENFCQNVVDIQREVSLVEMDPSSVIHRVKLLKQDSVLGAVGESAAIFRTAGGYLRVDRISSSKNSGTFLLQPVDMV
jgi:hypothetical protein